MTKLGVKKSLLKNLDYGDQARLGGGPIRSQYGDNLFTTFAKHRRYSHYGLYAEESHESQTAGNYCYKFTFFIGFNPEKNECALFPGRKEGLAHKGSFYWYPYFIIQNHYFVFI